MKAIAPNKHVYPKNISIFKKKIKELVGLTYDRPYMVSLRVRRANPPPSHVQQAGPEQETTSSRKVLPPTKGPGKIRASKVV